MRMMTKGFGIAVAVFGVDDDGASGAGTAGAVRRPPGFMDRIGQYRAFGRITGTAEVPSDVPGR
jgi:hypothetical protein